MVTATVKATLRSRSHFRSYRHRRDPNTRPCRRHQTPVAKHVPAGRFLFLFFFLCTASWLPLEPETSLHDDFIMSTRWSKFDSHDVRFGLLETRRKADYDKLGKQSDEVWGHSSSTTGFLRGSFPARTASWPRPRAPSRSS